MKLTYGRQLTLSVVLILLCNVLSTLCHHWIYRSIGFGLCGLLWIFHPIMPGTEPATPAQNRMLRAAGVILILLGIFTRSYIY